MKSLKSLFVLLALFTGVANSQTVTYNVPVNMLSSMTPTDPFGDFCFQGDLEQLVTGSVWGIDWNSTSNQAVSSITVEMSYSNEEGNGPYTVSLNSVSQTTHNPIQQQCVLHIQTLTFSPTSYNSNSLNQLRFDYTPGGDTHFMQPNAAWGNGVYARVIVDYIACTPTTGTDVQNACNSYTWTDGITYTSSNNTAVDTFMNAAGCDSIVTLDLTINTVDTSVMQSGAMLTANLSSATYQWVDCDNNFAPISGETAQSYTAIANGNYAVIVSQDCSDTSACYSVTGIGVEEFSFENDLSIYPNPFENRIQVTLGGSYKGIVAKITDINGKLIHNKVIGEASNFALNTDLSSGVYFLEIRDEDGRVKREKIIKK